MGLAAQFTSMAANLFSAFSDFSESLTHSVPASNPTAYDTADSDTAYTGISCFRTNYTTPEEQQVAGAADTKIICLASGFTVAPNPDDTVTVSSEKYKILQVRQQTISQNIVHILDCQRMV